MGNSQGGQNHPLAQRNDDEAGASKPVELIGKYVRETVEAATDPLHAEIRELQSRVADLEKHGIEYRGVYQRARNATRADSRRCDHGARCCRVRC